MKKKSLKKFFISHLKCLTKSQFIFIALLLLYRFLKFSPHIYLFMFKRPLFYLEFNRFRFKKIKKFTRLIRLSRFVSNSSNKLTDLINLKKNASGITLKKKLLKKSLYNNKFFFSRSFNQKRVVKLIRLKRKFRRRSITSFNKFFISYLNSERFFFLTALCLKKKTQHNTTRRVLSLSKYNPLKYRQFLELSILNLLIRLKFCLSSVQASNLIESKTIFVNFKLIARKTVNLKKNDVIQLIYTHAYFYYYKYVYNLAYKRLSKINYCVWRIQLSKKRKNKQHIRSFPSWLSSIFFLPYSVPKYIEVDFTSLTACLLFEPRTVVEFSPYIYWSFNYYLYKLMSWKRIV